MREHKKGDKKTQKKKNGDWLPVSGMSKIPTTI